jgi:NAD(P)-dependent dehydrogenase (short-subunit alcohol dehydrogenase family)
MSRVFITGSSTGLGLMAAELLVSQGHQVVLHARSADRAVDARRQLRQPAAVVIGACLRDRATLAGCAVELAGARMGANQDGWFRCTGRHGPGAPDPGLARRQR